MKLQHDEGQVISIIMDQRQTRNRVQQAIRKPTYMQYVRKRMAEMDYYNGIRTAEEEGLKEGLKKGEAIGKKIGKKKAEIKWILKLHDGDVPVKIIAQVAEKTVDEVINIINNE